MHDFIEYSDYVDSILIVDKNYNIVYKARYNPRFKDNIYNNIQSEYINKNFFEIYKSITPENSSLAECAKTKKVVKRYNQTFTDFKGYIFTTNNVTIPIIQMGKLVGVIELSRDITSIADYDNIKKDESLERKTQDYSVAIYCFEDILTTNLEMKNNIEKAKIFSKSNKPVLIYGETGTGKELFAQSMYNYSTKFKKKFIAQNCAALPENLIESILFGSRKGAFTGAENRVGLIEQADGGTLFLDELNSMPIGIQAKLLRVIQDGMIRPIGSEKEKKINVKIIAAINIDPMEAISRNIIREDLFYRFSSSTIRLPALRERKEDILYYANLYLEKFNIEYGKSIKGFSSQLIEMFLNYDWLGNVRELMHIIDSAVSLSTKEILEVNNLPIYMKNNILGKSKEKDENLKEPMTIVSLKEAVLKTEIDLIVKSLMFTKGNITKASELLDIPRQTLKYKIDKYDINSKYYKRQ